MSSMPFRSPASFAYTLLCGLATLAPLPNPILADGDVTFVDVSADPTSQISTYARARSTTADAVDALRIQSLMDPVGFGDLVFAPMMPRGLPGVAIFDFDLDGDLDLYVTNGPERANSLFSNQLEETGAVRFLDVATPAGVAAAGQDSFGTCSGDLDNDGDPDLLVLGRKQPNLLFENLGDGSFAERPQAGIGGGDRTSISCSMGDVNGNGLLDIVVANSFDQTISVPIFGPELFALNEHNFLFLNDGGLSFSDASDGSGITVNGGYPPGGAGITWATAIVDVDLDGDADVLFADDQGGVPAARVGGVDRAFLHVFLNDGSGHFVDSPIFIGPNSAAEWMGLGFGDLDCDGTLDLAVSCFGDYGNDVLGLPYIQGGSSSRWLYGNGDGTFSDPGLGDLQGTPFAWGNAIFDYDADGDLDILFHGGLDAAHAVNISDNPGALLVNEGCTGSFSADLDAIEADHLRRNVRGMAIGDLDRNGFDDVVTVANFISEPPIPLVPPVVTWGSPYDATGFFAPMMAMVGTPQEPLFQWLGLDMAEGDLKVELNSGNGNRSARLRLVGSVGLTPGGRVNRDGLGGVISFTPRGGQTVLRPVYSGGSHTSQHALETTFGLGDARRGRVEVLWPGGVRNRLYDVKSGSVVAFPEIPCSFDADWPSVHAYLSCVRSALDDLKEAGVIGNREAARLFSSAVRAFQNP